MSYPLSHGINNTALESKKKLTSLLVTLGKEQKRIAFPSKSMSKIQHRCPKGIVFFHYTADDVKWPISGDDVRYIALVYYLLAWVWYIRVIIQIVTNTFSSSASNQQQQQAR